MKPADLGLKAIWLTYWDMDHLDISKHPNEQRPDPLTEDLARANFGRILSVEHGWTESRVMLDIGWIWHLDGKPAFFYVEVIEDAVYEAPAWSSFEIETWAELVEEIARGLEEVKNILQRPLPA